ncbi:MAG: helix-turn-helix domain-containing protein [Acidimicrobiia bacterium]
MALLLWPDDSERRDLLALDGRPRLLIVDEQAPPPEVADPLEDWIRRPYRPDDLEVRAAALAERSRQLHLRPRLDADGLLFTGDHRIILSEAQVPVVQILVERFGHVVTLDELEGAYRAGGGLGGPDALNRFMTRCRAQLEPAGLDLRRIRGRGYLLCLAPPTSP